MVTPAAGPWWTIADVKCPGWTLRARVTIGSLRSGTTFARPAPRFASTLMKARLRPHCSPGGAIDARLAAAGSRGSCRRRHHGADPGAAVAACGRRRGFDPGGRAFGWIGGRCNGRRGVWRRRRGNGWRGLVRGLGFGRRKRWGIGRRWRRRWWRRRGQFRLGVRRRASLDPGVPRNTLAARASAGLGPPTGGLQSSLRLPCSTPFPSHAQ
jgi:hypothetical protein